MPRAPVVFVVNSWSQEHPILQDPIGHSLFIGAMAESATEVKLFGKWSLDDVEIADISLVVSPEITKNISCW